jgi:hypothetical protein
VASTRRERARANQDIENNRTYITLFEKEKNSEFEFERLEKTLILFYRIKKKSIPGERFYLLVKPMDSDFPVIFFFSLL